MNNIPPTVFHNQDIQIWKMNFYEAAAIFFRPYVYTISTFCKAKTKNYLSKEAIFDRFFTLLDSLMMTSQNASFGQAEKLRISRFSKHILSFSQNVYKSITYCDFQKR